MKVAEAMKIIDPGWVRKRKGFRVCFQKRVKDEFITEYVPGEEEKPLESDVVTWRLAWKLAEASKIEPQDIKEGDIVNITVVDDLGEPFNYYATNQLMTFNMVKIEDQ